MSQSYSLTFVNQTSQAGVACLYQQDPQANAYPLAWFTHDADPQSSVDFTWLLDYYFYWTQSQPLEPGVVVRASQRWNADLRTNNTITFAGGRGFVNPRVGPPGMLTIDTDGTIPMNMFVVGIGMSGAGTFAVPAQPNINVVFTPHPTYWITFGQYAAGQVLDPGSNSSAMEIAFPPGVFAMTVTLAANGTWSIAPS